MPATTSSSTVSTELLEDGTLLVRGDRGTARVSRLAPDVFLYRFEGHLDAKMFDPAMRFAREALERADTVVLLGDGEAWKSYDPDYRSGWTQWFRKYRHRVRAAHLLSPSPIVRMGAQVINLALGTSFLNVYKERRAFNDVVKSFARK